MTLRTVTERATRRLHIKRRLPPAFGRAPLWTTPSGGLRYLFKRMKNVDPELLGLARELVNSGDVVWDVGASVGLFSVAAAACAGPSGQVIAIEADDDTVRLLRRTALIQPRGSAPIIPIAAALCRDVGLRVLHIAKRTRSTNFLEGYGSSQAGGVAESRTVVGVTLDWLGQRLPRPKVVKIDVEGAELEVLEGAQRLLREARPTLICEVSDAVALDVHDLLTGLDYVVVDGSVPRGVRVALDRAPWSTIAFPR